MTCKDCILEPKCILRISYSMGDDEITGKELTNMEECCRSFKNKADFVEVKHGEWKASVMSTGAPHCSLCNGVAQLRHVYCPHCGAKMDKK